MGFGAGPLYTNALMGQAPSTAEWEHVREACSTILREGSIRVGESENLSLPDSSLISRDCTDQTPDTTAGDEDMITQDSLLRLPNDNASCDLGLFLRTTGPSEPHRTPSRNEVALRAAVAQRSPFRFLRFRQRRPAPPSAIVFKEPNDEGGLLAEIPKGVEQKVSSTGVKSQLPPGRRITDDAPGTRYLALQVASVEPEECTEGFPAESPTIMESRLSISFVDSINPSVVAVDNWTDGSSNHKSQRRPPTPHGRYPSSIFSHDDAVLGAIDHSSTPIRPPASDPPSPMPESPVSLTRSYQSSLTERPAKWSFDLARALSSQPVNAAISSSLTLLEHSGVEPPVHVPSQEGGVEIEHPTPRRLASHTILLQRSSSSGPFVDSQIVSDSPGPPARSPLRLRRNLGQQNKERAMPKTAPIIKDAREYNAAIQPIRPTVVTDCTGPIKRPRSRGKHAGTQSPYPMSRKKREERTRVRKLRDRPMLSIPASTRTIDAIIAPNPQPKQKLQKARPFIHIPALRPSNLRAPSPASSNTSWKLFTESTRTPVSPVSSGEISTVNREKTGYTPISPISPHGSESADSRMALSPVMLVAEEIPIQKPRASQKPARVSVKEARSYTPRPRSASIPRSAMKGRSRQGTQTPTRPNTPNSQQQQDDAPPLPSPPPNRALPPTPPASGSEKPKKSKSIEAAEYKKELLILPKFETTSKTTAPQKRSNQAPHVATLDQKRSSVSFNANSNPRIHARLEALERQNTLLFAALDGMLRNGGALNGPLSILGDTGSQNGPMVWESRIARKSAASHAASSSNGSALDMYLHAKQGSTYGC